MTGSGPPVVVVDFGLGNLFSVARACEVSGIRAVTSDDPGLVREAAGLVLPGVGAFGDAMDSLRGRGLVKALLDKVETQVPVLAVCLGMQLLLRESFEFGRHEGLGVIDGSVLPLMDVVDRNANVKVPHIGWSRIEPAEGVDWGRSPLADLRVGAHMYFVHSYYAQVRDSAAVRSWTTYGGSRFVSSLQVGSVFACQFHPERSGSAGLEIYRRALAPATAPNPS